MARANSTTPWAILTSVLKALVDGGVVPTENMAWLSLDPNELPPSPAADKVAMISMESIEWDGSGDAGLNEGTGVDGAQLIVEADLVATLWLRDQRDLTARADDVLLKNALPKGSGIVQTLMNTLFEKDLADVTSGDLILMRPMIFKSLTFPSKPRDGAPWRDFRSVWNVMFTWDVSS